MSAVEIAADALQVLIVEDEALIAWLIEDALALQGHASAGIADTLATALDLADRQRPDLALCDVKLARGDSGVAVAEALAARGIPSLFLSGNCPGAGGHPLIIGCVDKPFRTDTLGIAATIAHARANGQPMTAPVPPGMKLF